MVRIPGIPMKKMKNYLLMGYMKAIPYLKPPRRKTSISGRSDTSLKIRNGGLQILEKTLQKAIRRTNTLRCLNTVVGFSIYRDFATIAPIQVVWLPVQGRLFTRGKKMELSLLTS